MSALRKIGLVGHHVRRYQAIASSFGSRASMLVLAAARCRHFGAPDPISRLARRLFPILRITPRTIAGSIVYLDPSDASQIDVFDEIAIEGVYDLDRLPFEPAEIVDCGGHIGLFATLARARFPQARLTVFEPLPENVALIERTRAANGVTFALERAAVSVADGEATFNARNSCGGSLDAHVGGITRTVVVPVVNLVERLARERPRKLLLKMDIEGEEERLIPALLGVLPGDCVVMFETHSGERGWKLVTDALAGVGFDVTLERERGVYRDGTATRRAS